MKKYLAITLILALIMCSLLGCAIVADASTTNSVTDIHLVNPSSTVVIGDNMYIADNVTDTSSVILVFDLSYDTPVYTSMIELDGNINSMRGYYDILYIIQDSSYTALDTTSNSTTTTNTAITDIAVFVHSDNQYVYTIRDGNIYRGNSNKTWHADSITISDNTMYILEGTDNAYITLVDDDNMVNEDYSIGSSNIYTTITTIGQYVISYNSTTISIDSTVIATSALDIDCVSMYNDIVLVQSNNNVTGYSNSTGAYEVTFVVGSDTVSIDAPSLDDITGYTLVQSTGYPTNIVYKTTDDTSIAQLIELDSQQILILDYDGASNNSYYYVYTDDGFGWIKKGADTLAEESTLTIIDTTLNGTANYNAKLISPYSVTIYQLPCYDYQRCEFVQSADEPTTVALLQQFVDTSNITWYYISYTDDSGSTQYGFVTSGDIGYIYSSGASSNFTLDSDTPYLKINSPLTSEVYMYLTQQLSDTEQLVDSNGDSIILSDGTRVNVITVGDNASYLQVTTDSGTYYGWVSNDNLVATGALTTSTTTGLILLAVAILLIIVTILIVKARKDKLIRNN